MDTMHEYTDDRADLRTRDVPVEPQVGWASNDGSALKPWWWHGPLHQVGIDRVVDTRVGPHVCGVTVAVIGDQMPVLQLGGKPLRPFVRHGRVLHARKEPQVGASAVSERASDS